MDYTPAYPSDVEVASSVKEFISSFYSVSDTPGKDEEWLSYYVDDAIVVMGKDTATGRDELLQLRRRMWEKVQSRRHTVYKVLRGSFPAAGGAETPTTELALFGTVEYRLRENGGREKSTVDWAGHARLRSDEAAGGAWRFEYYRVYMQR
ncbi:hypothetical protein NKR23_g2368 [Pleurostoma richardsiae]|uniref:SnoaL-like domain-containing protein n=1 Tax=Pleurostoma richardsiae TaxID=41990 RepID=A0AA38VVA6_9PEZI|nr:hypothetical protein NKR23_g2368 [Pleurostoma richardsiae]